jgi:hypothetical protein
MRDLKVRKPSTRDSRQTQILAGLIIAGNEILSTGRVTLGAS